jgi:hypothetical protein
VPLTASGQLALVASADLGVLGSKDGPRINYDWVLPNVAPLLLPWLAIAVLLALKPNRRAAAWWILLPLGCVFAFSLAPPDVLSNAFDFATDDLAALAFGLAAVWLLSDYLRQNHRLLTFLCVVAALAGFGGLTLFSRLSLTSTNQLAPGLIMLAVGLGVTAVALLVLGLICRKHFHLAGIYLWLLALLAVFWVMIALPFFLMDVLGSGGRIEWSAFFTPVLAVAVCHFAAMLPFLILSSACPFYRDRLRSLLHVKEEAAVVAAPAPEASLKA